MKNLRNSIVALLLCVIMLTTTVLTSCSNVNGTPSDPSDNLTESGDGDKTTEDNENTEGNSTEENKKQIPIYQGMTITGTNSSTLNLAVKSYRSGAALSSSNSGNNGNHYGHYKGDCTDDHNDFDKNNPYPDNNEHIEDEIRNSLEVVGSTKEIYYTTPNQYIYINIHISNPDKYEILSFTLNGEKYSSYMFEQGSTLETLILKVNVGRTSGIVEYTIDQIKYVDGTEIKDVKIDGEKTVKAGIKIENQVSADISNVNIGTNSISFSAKISDKDSLIAYSNGAIKAVLYDGKRLIATKDITIGDNSIAFDILTTNSIYQYAIIAFYDDLSGNGVEAHILSKNAFSTNSVVLFDNIAVDKTNITFGFKWDESISNKALTSLKLYQGETLVKNLPVDATSVGELLSGENYTLIAEYIDLGNTESIVLEFTTLMKEEYIVSIINPTNTQTSVGFEISEINADNVGAVTKIEIYKGEQLVKEAVNLDVRSFDGLLSNTTYTIKVTYTYDLNNGAGEQAEYKTLDITTGEKSRPTIAINNASCDKNSIYLEISKNDIDNTITEFEVALLIDGVVVTNKKFNDSCTIDELLYDTTYSVRVTVYYDLNDGSGVHSKSVSTTVTTPNYVDAQGVSYKTYIDGTAEVVGFTAGTTEIIIPESIGVYSVTSIADFVFENSAIISIHIPSTVQKIGAYAFKNCSDLITVELNEGLEEIGTYAFERCNNIQKFVIPLSVSKIGYRAFFPYNCRISYHYDATSNIYIKAASKPSGWDDNFMCSACQNAFWGFDKFVEQDGILFALSNNKTAEAVCRTKTTGSLIIPNVVNDCNVIGIAPRAFVGYKGDIEFPDSLDYIDFEAFRDVTTPELNLPESLRYIRKNAFNNIGTSAININSSYICISTGAFDSWHTPDLANVALELYISLNAMGYIEKNAFAGSYNLRYVNIPSNMTIEDDAFIYCDNLQICCLADRRPVSWGDEWEDGAPVFWSSYVDEQGVVYKLNSNIKFEDKSTMTIIDYLNVDESTIYIPDKILGRVVYMIGEEAFWDTDVSKLYIPKNIQVIAERALSTNIEVVYQIGSVFVEENIYGIELFDIQHGCIYLLNYEGAKLHKNLFDAYKYELIEGYYDEESYIYYDYFVKEVDFDYTEIEIPSSIGEYSVTRIDGYVFSGCSNLISVVIPNSITVIGEGVFYNCTNLVELIIPDSVTFIRGDAFDGCEKLIEDENGIYYIGNWCIGVADDIAEVIIREGTTHVKNDAFRSSNITRVVMPNSIVYIGETAFYSCANLESVTLSNSVTSISNGLFMWCANLTNVVMFEGVTDIADRAFYGCINLQGLEISDRVTRIGSNAFYQCFKLIAEENGVYYINNWCIDVADDVTDVMVKEGVTHIADSAFAICNNLMVVIIPESVISVGNGAFSYSPNLSIYCKASGKPNAWNSSWNSNRPVVWGYTCSHGTTKDGWKWANTDCGIIISGYSGSETEIVVPDKINDINVVSISDRAFYARTDIKSATISNSVTSIGNYAFAECSDLANVTLGESVIHIGDSAFEYCRNLTSIIIPNQVTYIGDSAFEYCSNLTSMIIPNEVTHIGDYAFYGCENLESVTIGTGVISIGDSSFGNCYSIVSVIIPDNVIAIGKCAFYWCKNLKNITIGSGVTSIGGSAFAATALESVTFKDTTNWYRTQSESDFNNKTGGTAVTVTTPSRNADYFDSFYYWYKL